MRAAANLIRSIPKIPPNIIPKCPNLFNTRTSHLLAGASQTRQTLLQRKNTFLDRKVPDMNVKCAKRALHPFFMFFLRPMAKLSAILFGRFIRNWWSKLTPEEKRIVLDKIKGRRRALFMTGSAAVLGFTSFYYYHIVETPITKRKRFVILDDEFMGKISDLISKQELEDFQRDIVPKNHPFHVRTARVTSALIFENKDIPEMRQKDWSVVVVDRPKVTNAFSLPNGQIFVFTGILNLCTNDDQLAIVLSHEMSHTLLSHTREILSKFLLHGTILVIPSLLLGIFFSFTWAVMSDWMTGLLTYICIDLPFNRSLEEEADVVALYLAARSCFDVREAPKLLSKIDVINSAENNVEWFSTHPSNERRQERLKELLPLALQVREERDCPRLKPYNMMNLPFPRW